MEESSGRNIIKTNIMNKEFASRIMEGALKTGFSPMFVTALTCIESGWGKTEREGNNIFGDMASEDFKGEKVLRHTIVVSKDNPKIYGKENIIYAKKLKCGLTKYTCMMYFKTFRTVSECLSDHLHVFDGFTVAMGYRLDMHEFPKRIQHEPKGGIFMHYDSDPNFADTIEQTYKSLKKLGLYEEIPYICK